MKDNLEEIVAPSTSAAIVRPSITDVAVNGKRDLTIAEKEGLFLGFTSFLTVVARTGYLTIQVLQNNPNLFFGISEILRDPYYQAAVVQMMVAYALNWKRKPLLALAEMTLEDLGLDGKLVSSQQMSSSVAQAPQLPSPK